MKPVDRCAPRSSIHEADAILVGGRADPTGILALAIAMKPFGRNALKLNGSVTVAVPADYTHIL